MLSKRYSHLIRLFAIISLSYFLASCGDGDGPAPVYDTAAPPPPSEAYTLVWSDEFDVDGAPNVENWRIEEGYGDNGWGNNEWQKYTDEPENLRVEDGNLIITARCSYADPDITNPPDPGRCNSAVRDDAITSGRINTNDKLEVKYGSIQARIKVPPGKGTWPAFWMLGAEFPDKPWPRAGEIDIVEIHQFYSDINTTHFAMHWCDDSIPGPVPCVFDPGRVFEEQFKKFDFALSDDYHVFEADWSEDRVIGKIDGNAYFSLPIDPDTREEFLSKFFMILNVAVGGTLGGPPNDSTTWPQEMLVDWVRVYQKNQPDEVELVPDQAASPFTYENFVRIVNSVEYGGDSVVSTIQRTISEDDEKFNDITPPAVTPLTGNTIVEFDYESGNTFFSGAAFLFKQKDITHYEKLLFSIYIDPDTDPEKDTTFPNLYDIAVEMQDNRFLGDGDPGKISIPLSTYTPVAESGYWKSYEIPLTDFVGVNLDNVASWGFWNPKDASGQLIAGKLYLDDIRLVSVPCTANGVVSFSTDTINGNQSSTQISVTDTCLANKNETVVVVVDNGTEAIGVSVPIIASGLGVATVNFGPTKDASSTIAITEGTVLSASYTDANGADQTDTTTVSTAPLAVYSETKVDNVLVYTGITEESTATNETSTAVTALEGSVSLQADFSVPGGGSENGYAFDFPDTTGGLLLNGGFEVPDASGGLVSCGGNPGTGITNWECFNFPFVFNNSFTTEPSPLAHGGSQVIGAVGVDAIVQQSVSVNPGDTVNISVYAMNWNNRPLSGIAIMQLNFLDASNNVIAGSQVLGSADGTQTYTLAGKAGTAVGDWTRMELSGVAPAGTANAQIFLIHVVAGGDPASTVFWDDANLTVDSTSQVTSDISYYQTLKFGINTTAAGALQDLEVRMEDASSNVASLFLSDYTPTAGDVSGWDIYEIPLAGFTGLDKTDIRALGFYNASSVVNTAPSYPQYFATTLYFDDVHFALDAAAALTGVLVNSPIDGATFSTATQSGITNALGEFQYLPGEMVTFTIGGIVLGAVPGAPVVTPVELTGSVNPTDQDATNQLVFLQSIDADQDPSNGITISTATQDAALTQTLDFTLDSAAFTTAVTGVVNDIAPGNAIVSETDALNNYYTTFPPAASAVNTTIDVVPGTVDSDGTDAGTITVQAKDSSGNNITVSAGTVTLSSTGNAVLSPVTDQGDGTYKATVTNNTAETVTITGTIEGNTISDNAIVTFIGALSLADTTIDATSPIEADGIAKSTITVQAKDTSLNNFVNSVGTVDLTINVSATATFENGTQTTQATDNGDGSYTALVKNTVAEDVTITGTITGPVSGAIVDNATISFIVGAASGATSTISAVASAAVDNGSNTGISSTITVQAKDAGGNNLTASGGTVTLSTVSSTAIISGVNDNNDGTYTATVTDTVTETVTITGTIAGNTITDTATILFGNTVGVSSETNSDSLLDVSAPAYNDAACDQTVTLTDGVPTGTYPSYEGTVSGEVSSLPASPSPGCVGIVVNFGASPTDTVTPYNQDFDGLDATSASALGPFGEGFSIFADVWDGEVGTGTFLYSYGPFAAPNGGPGFSAIAFGEGQGDSVTDQYLNIYSDYNNADHANGFNINTAVFKEQTIDAADIPGVFTLKGDFKAPSSCGIGWDPNCGADGMPGGGDDFSPNTATASIFIKTLDPSAGFATTNDIRFDSTIADPNTWGTFSIEVRLTDPLLAGQILQFGFGTVATLYNDSGVYYDNLSFAPRTVDVTGYATLRFALDTSGVTVAAFADLELRMVDANGAAASVYLSDYTPTPANPPVAGAVWQLYEIPLVDFTGTLDKTIMKSLTFTDPSSTVSKPPGTVTPLQGTIRTDDIHFIVTP